MTTTIQRPLRGSRVSSFYPVKSLPSLSSLDSAFQLQEYISLLIRLDMHDVDTIVSLPGKNTSKDREADKLLEPQESESPKTEEKEAERERKIDFQVDRACWIYEQLRRLAQDLSYPLITTLQQECNRTSCPEMKAGEWLYLCVAHGNDGALEQCCAIDYILHTLDSATALLNSPRAFPSRLSIQPSSYRHFSSLARRLSRIFAHAYFHHREVFEQAEAESSLYARFLKLTSEFDLVPADFLVIPQRAVQTNGEAREDEVEPPRLLAAAISPLQDRISEPHLVPETQSSQISPILSKDSPGRTVPGTDSPRKIGRSRTDTMVLSDGFNVAEELAAYHALQHESHSAPAPGILLHNELASASQGTADEQIGQPPPEYVAQAPEVITIPPPESLEDDASHLGEHSGDPADSPSELSAFEDVPLVALAEPTKTTEADEPPINSEPQNDTETAPSYASPIENIEPSPVHVPEDAPGTQEAVPAQNPESAEGDGVTSTEVSGAQTQTEQEQPVQETEVLVEPTESESAEPEPEPEPELSESELVSVQLPEPTEEPSIAESDESGAEESPHVQQTTEEPVIIDLSDKGHDAAETVVETSAPATEPPPSAPADVETSPEEPQEISVEEEPSTVETETAIDLPDAEATPPESESDITDENVPTAHPELATLEVPSSTAEGGEVNDGEPETLSLQEEESS